MPVTWIAARPWHVRVTAGAKALLAEGERERFLRDEWPRIRATIERLGL